MSTLEYTVENPVAMQDMRTALGWMTDRVYAGTQTIAASCAMVLRDLADVPKVGELSSDFISMYESMYDKAPLMPPSILYAFMRDPMTKDSVSLPMHTVGTDEFKLQYLARGFWKDKLAMSEIPGLVNLLKYHNMVVGKRSHVTEADVQRWLDQFHPLMKSIITNSVLARQFSIEDQRMDLDSITKPLIKTYTLGKPINDVIRVVESVDQSVVLTDLSNVVADVSSANKPMRKKRDTLIADNIIDLNINPINLNALMRDMPFIHLYKFSNAADEAFAHFLDQDLEPEDYTKLNKGIGAADTMFKVADTSGAYDNQNANAKKMLLGLLIKPTAKLTYASYSSVLGRIMKGEMQVQGFGRPKYLGDELYYKSLFGGFHAATANDPTTKPAAMANGRSYLLHYKDDTVIGSNPQSTEMIAEDLGAGNLEYFRLLGKMRFDTVFMRYIFWLVNIQRVLRAKLARELTYYNGPVSSEFGALAPGNTELYGRDMHRVPNAMNYQY